MKFHFPLIWLPVNKYKLVYKMSKKVEKQCWEEAIWTNGFIPIGNKT
jgi:hypothetical protein